VVSAIFFNIAKKGEIDTNKADLVNEVSQVVKTTKISSNL
jgi:hypothetical protein